MYIHKDRLNSIRYCKMYLPLGRKNCLLPINRSIAVLILLLSVRVPRYNVSLALYPKRKHTIDITNQECDIHGKLTVPMAVLLS